ncbi:hypothetical protein BESB_083850 [Besnoitia besnoiti]|uniref:Transmembrane protein n=1 Tax=Besnoitia besnoiti TaxID=94643 RepID=A0A2A9MB78_BESBE|nr:hypothetical protein BESB_083850 [Besnoitia besnoiti]PFH33186.1 hypothetical protein BESB_083850 [Besnoitia besnoiti]
MNLQTENGAVAASAAALDAVAGQHVPQEAGPAFDTATAADSAPAGPADASVNHEGSDLPTRESQQKEPLLKAEDKQDGDEDSGDVSLAVGGDQAKEESGIMGVVLALLLSFVFPPIGCLAFCFSLRYPENSRRYFWAVRALELGSLLSFLYSLLLVMLLSDLKLVYTQNDKAHFGVGY